MVVDLVTITVSAGNGGRGGISFLSDGQTRKGGPDGGNGGKGGDIYVVGSTNVTDLREFRFKKRIVAQNGVDGKRHNLYGSKAADILITVPLGTQITDTQNNTSFEITNNTEKVLIARGGRGGKGNASFKSSTNQAPRYAQPGEPGEQKTLTLELKMIAEVGIIGLPNTGKSTLLGILTNAHPAIGDYPFTTLDPTVGMLSGHSIADIPGIIEGASEGKGLGVRFLKHIEKTKLLIHCVDVSAPDPIGAYSIIRKEFKSYGQKLTKKQEIVLLNKTDASDEKTIQDVTREFKKKKKVVMTSSIYDDASIEKLKEEILKRI